MAQQWHIVNLKKHERFSGLDFADSIASPITGTGIMLLTMDISSDGKSDSDLNLENFNWPEVIRTKVARVCGLWVGDPIIFCGDASSDFKNMYVHYTDITFDILPGVVAMCLSQDTLRNRIEFTETIKPMVQTTMKQLGMTRSDFLRFATRVEEIESLRQQLGDKKRRK